MRTAGDDIAEVLALMGVRPVWDDASRRVTGLEPIPPTSWAARASTSPCASAASSATRSRTWWPCWTTPCGWSPAGRAADDNYVRAHARADLAEHGDWRRATMRIFGSKPGAYGAGILPLIDSRNWRDDADLAEVYAVWGGFAYGRGPGRPCRRGRTWRARTADRGRGQEHRHPRARHRRLRRLLPVPRRHDRHRPRADRQGPGGVHRRLHQPRRVRTRTPHRGDRPGLPGPGGQPALDRGDARHGYKGAFELAATVDYLFGYDATAGVVADWMYEQAAPRPTCSTRRTRSS
jgi:cobaltochelatase CobN